MESCCTGILQEDSSSPGSPDSTGEAAEDTQKLNTQQLQQELQTAQAKVASIQREADQAKQTAGTELALMRRQLTSCQAALAEAEQVVWPQPYCVWPSCPGIPL